MYEQKKFQTTEESLHWISYNLKRIATAMEARNAREAAAEEPSQAEGQQSRNNGEECPF